MIGALAYLTCGDDQIEIFNCLRTHTYLRNHSKRPDRHGCCPDISPWLGCPVVPEPVLTFDDPDDPTSITATLSEPVSPAIAYTNPADDEAWWYRSGRPESAGFWGFEAVRVGGLYQSTTTKTFAVSTMPCGDLTYGPAVSQGVELVVEGLLHGATCCAVAYGYRALIQQLSTCGSECTGTSLRFLSGLPEVAPVDCASDYVLPEETTTPWRTLNNVTVIEYPSIVGKEGMGCGTCGCAPLTWVRFVLRSNPGLYLDPVLVLAAEVPNGDTCTIYCEDPCVEVEPFPDPLCTAPILPLPSVAPSGCFCPPVALNRVCYETTSPSTMFDFQLSLEVYAGATKALRNLRLRVWRQIGALAYDPDVYTYCNTDADIGISYIPVNGTWELIPGQGAFVTVAGVTAPARQSLFTGSGQPRTPCVKLPSGDYVFCIDADVLNTGDDATIVVRLVEVEPT